MAGKGLGDCDRRPAGLTVTVLAVATTSSWVMRAIRLTGWA